MSDRAPTDTSNEQEEGRTQRANGGLPDPEEMSQEEIDEIEAERKRRLDPDNRPEMAEVDNTHLEFDFERGELVDREELFRRKAESSREESSSAGSGQEGANEKRSSDSGLPDLDEMSQEEIDQIEAERERRLDPENRPDMAEVDNTDKEFDFERGELVDSKNDTPRDDEG